MSASGREQREAKGKCKTEKGCKMFQPLSLLTIIFLSSPSFPPLIFHCLCPSLFSISWPVTCITPATRPASQLPPASHHKGETESCSEERESKEKTAQIGICFSMSPRQPLPPRDCFVVFMIALRCRRRFDSARRHAATLLDAVHTQTCYVI